MEKEEKVIGIEDLGEFGLIDRITEKIKTYNKSTNVGPGDDAAVIKIKDHTVVSTDMMVEGIHFEGNS